MNREAIRKTVKVGLMIGSEISLRSMFDRKNYFYPDMSKNYQITQQAAPLCIGGAVEIEVGGQKKTIRVNHIHQEEDAAKITHMENSSEIDFNRASTPLMELVTEPDMASPDEAIAFLTALKEMLIYAGISDCNLEMGHLRCDVNSSVRPVGTDKLGVKCEIKNMNTFKGIHRALEYELERQVETLRKGGKLVQETRRWDDVAGITLPMRSKEYAHDYRYFPEPDLPPVVLDAATVEAWRAELPELPAAKRARFIATYGLPEYDAGVITADQAIAGYFEAAAQQSKNYKAVSNWVMGELLRALGEKGQGIARGEDFARSAGGADRAGGCQDHQHAGGEGSVPGPVRAGRRSGGHREGKGLGAGQRHGGHRRLRGAGHRGEREGGGGIPGGQGSGADVPGGAGHEAVAREGQSAARRRGAAAEARDEISIIAAWKAFPKGT